MPAVGRRHGKTTPSRVAALPSFVEPMLAKPGVAFDSDRHLFEVKWDGTRALAFIDRSGFRLLNRRRVDMTSRYPELAGLAKVGGGTVLDGEIVVLRGGKPDFQGLQRREQARSPLRVAMLAKALPATYVAFDLLYDNYQPLLDLPLTERRDRLRQLVAASGTPGLIMSEGVNGAGVAYFDEACRQGLEGIVAKRLDSPYLPGKRSDCWLKIKRQETLGCVVIGFVPEGEDDFSALVIATPDQHGQLCTAGRVGTGFSARLRERINRYLWSHLVEKPVVPCRERALWVEPGLYCTVRCMERTPGGQLRAPAFGELVGHDEH